MPTYQYACTSCEHRFDAVQAFSDTALTECPECGGRLRKLYGSVGVVFKGSGFYRNDSRNGNSGKSSSGDSAKSGSGSKSESGSSGSTSGESKSSGSNSSGSKSAGSKSAGSNSSGSGGSANSATAAAS